MVSMYTVDADEKYDPGAATRVMWVCPLSVTPLLLLTPPLLLLVDGGYAYRPAPSPAEFRTNSTATELLSAVLVLHGTITPPPPPPTLLELLPPPLLLWLLLVYPSAPQSSADRSSAVMFNAVEVAEGGGHVLRTSPPGRCTSTSARSGHAGDNSISGRNAATAAVEELDVEVPEDASLRAHTRVPDRVPEYALPPNDR